MISLTKGVTSVDTTAAVQSVSAPDEQDAGPLVLSALCVSSFLATLNFFAATPFYPEMAEDLNTTVPLLGQVTTAMILISTVLGLAIGPLADRYGYRWPLVIGVLAIAINLTGIGLAPSYPVLLLLSLFGGLGDALVFGLPLAIAGLRYSGEAQRRAISWTLGSLSSAAIIGTPVLTAIGSATSWRAALVCAGALSAMAAVFVLLALPADGRHPQRALRVRELLSAYRPLLGHGPVLRQYAATALRAITWIGMLTYLGAFLSDEVGLSTSAVGLVFMVGGSGFALGNFLGGRLLGDAVHIRVALLCVAIAVLVGLLLLSTAVHVVVPVLFVVAFCGAVAGLGTTIILAAESPAGLGTTMMLNGSTLNLGTAIGAALGGVLLSIGGYSAMALGLPVFALLAAVITGGGPTVGPVSTDRLPVE